MTRTGSSESTLRLAAGTERQRRWARYLFLLSSEISRADESGISFWLPGQVNNLAAVPQQAPGWSWAEVYYHTTVSASGAVAAAREIQIGRFIANR